MMVFITMFIINNVNIVKRYWTGNQGLGLLDEEQPLRAPVSLFSGDNKVDLPKLCVM